MVNFCGCCTRTDIVREHLEDTLRICDVSAMGLYPSFPIACLSLFNKNIGKWKHSKSYKNTLTG